MWIKLFRFLIKKNEFSWEFKRVLNSKLVEVLQNILLQCDFKDTHSLVGLVEVDR